MRRGNIPAPNCIYKGIQKLIPGHYLEISAQCPEGKMKAYWDADKIVLESLQNPFAGTVDSATDEIERLLRDSVGLQMYADVPVGVFLSGGVDSSLIAALMQSHSDVPIKSFTIGFEESAFNEAGYAKQVARHLKTEHTELYVTAREALDVIPLLPSIYSEPFADSSQVPTFLVSKLAREKVTVALSGDGADEIFGGYNRYLIAYQSWSRMAHLPIALRKVLANIITSLSPGSWKYIIDPFQKVLPQNLRQSNVGDKMYKGAGALTAKNVTELYESLVTHWPLSSNVVIGAENTLEEDNEVGHAIQVDNAIEKMMAMDMMGYLPDDILTKVDRASMSVSLETRVPMLDQRIVEFAWRLPLHYKLNNGVGKLPLRQILYKYVPQELIDRPKTGFSIPMDSWLRGPLREWAESLLSKPRLERDGYFNSELIRAKWLEHLSGRHNWQNQLWNVLIFQSWLDDQ